MGSLVLGSRCEVSTDWVLYEPRYGGGTPWLCRRTCRAFVHRTAGLADPCARREVKRTLRGTARKAGRAQKQAEALTHSALAATQSTAGEPRRGRGGRLEAPQTASVLSWECD